MGRDAARGSATARGAGSGIGATVNPLDFIAEDHMREREVCALIDKLVATASVEKADLHKMLEFLKHHLPQHLADEEIDLFPLMLERCEPEDEIERVIARLHADHGHAFADAPAIVGILQSVDATSRSPSKDECRQMTEFAQQARRHLILENAVILPIARLRLSESDLNTMKRHMLERRGIQPPLEGT